MPFGYAGRILHVNLTTGKIEVEEPPESFYRMTMGGSGMAMHYLLRMVPAHADPLGPDNVLVLSVGVMTGAPISGQSRVMANAKSPLTGAIGDAQGGGFWPAEFRSAGFDAIVITGQSPRPVYLWVHDGEAELRDAAHLWGGVTGETEAALREELGDKKIEVLQIGPAGEKLSRMACIINMSNRACGRTGMGAVMGSKKLKAVAVRGHGSVELADKEKLRELARWGADNLEESGVWSFRLHGTAGGINGLQATGALPTRNWSSGVFEGWQKIWGQTMTETILKERDTCYGCVVRCKRVVETTGPFATDPRYGGPEYETIATTGSYCGIDDLEAISKANEICNKYGLDTISCGATVAFAMDCYEQGILTKEDTGGIDLHFGNAAAMVQMVEMIARREGLGDLLAEGSYRAAQKIGKGAEDLVVTGKKQEFPAHEPRAKRSLALIYAVNPFGADHMSHEHDPAYAPTSDPTTLAQLSQLGLNNPQHAWDLSEEKVRYALTTEYIYSALDCLGTCQFVWGPTWQLYNLDQLVEAVQAITGWRTSIYELMLVGARRLNMMRAFNAREGLRAADDYMPKKLQLPAVGGPTDGVSVKEEDFLAARAKYYQLAGWDQEGVPTASKLAELNLEWVADLLAD
ncbi:MAG: aldehyde ferredoxin oxidoreductase family protein [Chloroflexi bacterium]|jgi:aldehyde:ferredoxin oxidoreductase|nr:aldehyde ferredoxin oxidoreductase family protein [Chloroflexota bacterium]